MATLPELEEQFAIPGVLRFSETPSGLQRATVTLPSCTAELYLQGAHLTAWQPAGSEPAFFLSSRSHYTPGKAIRGGVPVIFPWFADPATSPVAQQLGIHAPAPSHGFARTSPWQITFAAVVGDELHLALALAPNEASRAFGYSSFQLVYELTLGRELRLRLSVANTGDEPLLFEEALHSYFAVSDVQSVTVDGLEGTDFLDKPDGFRRKHQTDALIHFAGETDRPYLDTTAPLTLQDPGSHRQITVTKANSATTVVWNPGEQLAATLADLGPGEWQRFACIEAANAGPNFLTLAPRETHTMEARIAVAPLA